VVPPPQVCVPVGQVHLPCTQVVPSGQQTGEVVLAPQIWEVLQQVPLMHWVPVGQQVMVPLAPVQACVPLGQVHLPFTHEVPSGQQTVWPVALTQVCAARQQTPSTQTDPAGQQVTVPSAAVQVCRLLGQVQRPLTQVLPSGQQVATVPAAPPQTRDLLQQTPLRQVCPWGQQVLLPQHGWPGGQQVPLQQVRPSLQQTTLPSFRHGVPEFLPALHCLQASRQAARSGLPAVPTFWQKVSQLVLPSARALPRPTRPNKPAPNQPSACWRETQVATARARASRWLSMVAPLSRN